MDIYNYYKGIFLDCINSYNLSDELKFKIIVEKPKQNIFGDISLNAPLVLSSYLKKSPMDIASEISDLIKDKTHDFSKVEIAKPGFINFTIKQQVLISFLENIKKDFGFPENLKKQKINLEFVSANPTGPLHVGHCRGAIFGDVLSNLLNYCGHEVTKEYYINDYGNQITFFVESIYFRILEILKKEKFPDNANLYPGEYIKDIAKEILDQKIINNFDNFLSIKEKLTEQSISVAMKLIKENLKDMGIEHDFYVSEKKIVKENLLDQAIEKLEAKGDIFKGILPKPKGDVEDWEPREQLLFKSTKYGDDVDRALQKSDKTWTYFANDIAYHFNKINRDFDLYINVLGADHAGYVKRLKSAFSAIDKNKKFEIKLSQIVKLYKGGQPFRMSKRAGDFILAKDLIDTVGKDSVRFMMVYRSSNSQLDFDFDAVTEKSKDNPVFYVQYACARINSIFNKIKNINDNEIQNANKSYLTDKHEINLIKKILEWPKIVLLCHSNLEVHYIPYYLYELAQEFHSYWNAGKEDNSLRIIDNPNEDILKARLFLLKKIFTIFSNGMRILDVKVPDKM